MSTHTPGPWALNATRESILDERGRVLMHDGGCSLFVTSIVEREANLRLAAAAPELLEALESLIKDIETDGGVDTSDWPLLDAAKAAIAKAVQA